MAYSEELLNKLDAWLDNGTVPHLNPGDRVVELGSQMINAGTPHAAVAAIIKKLNPSYDESELSRQFPVHPAYYAYTAEMWMRCGMGYFSYDLTEAPHSRVFDLNFGNVPTQDCGQAKIVTNIGTSEHVANQLNVFKIAHDLMAVGGVSIHTVPFTGWLNHGLFNYHPKFFFSLIVNNRYRLMHVDYSPPARYGTYGDNHDMFDGDSLPVHANVSGSQEWAGAHLPSGMLNLVIQRRTADEFVPPVDFAKGYFGDFAAGDLSALLKQDELPRSAWAEAYLKKTTPSQKTLIGEEKEQPLSIHTQGVSLLKRLRKVI